MSETTAAPAPRSLWQRVLGALATEFGGLHPRLNAYTFASGLLVDGTSGELRARLLRGVGFQVGRGTVVAGTLRITGLRGLQRKLVIGAECWLGADVVLDLCERITIGERVTIEPGVMVLTSTHELDSPAHRAGPVIANPVTIGDGALLRARSIVLPGVTIGAGAVVEPGAVVNKDVEANTRVGGIPAAKLESLAVAPAP
jgi:acetyltransferase-like isoleucine patch superfamily enzyme